MQDPKLNQPIPANVNLNQFNIQQHHMDLQRQISKIQVRVFGGFSIQTASICLFNIVGVLVVTSHGVIHVNCVYIFVMLTYPANVFLSTSVK